MELLFDECTPKKLRRHFRPHRVTLAEELGWKGKRNGKLLEQAQNRFVALITADTNLYHQNVVARFNIAVIVLRARRNSFEKLLPAVAEVLAALDVIKPGEVN